MKKPDASSSIAATASPSAAFASSATGSAGSDERSSTTSAALTVSSSASVSSAPVGSIELGAATSGAAAGDAAGAVGTSPGSSDAISNASAVFEAGVIRAIYGDRLGSDVGRSQHRRIDSLTRRGCRILAGQLDRGRGRIPVDGGLLGYPISRLDAWIIGPRRFGQHFDRFERRHLKRFRRLFEAGIIRAIYGDRLGSDVGRSHYRRIDSLTRRGCRILAGQLDRGRGRIPVDGGLLGYPISRLDAWIIGAKRFGQHFDGIERSHLEGLRGLLNAGIIRHVYRHRRVDGFAGRIGGGRARARAGSAP